jgi:hypothetical protein
MGSIKGMKFELALIDEADKSLMTGNSLLDLAYKEVREVNSSRITNAIKQYEDCIKLSDNILKQVKDLGLNSKETENIKSIAVKNLKEAQNIKTKISSI